jgi:hypothetical protein
MIKKLVLLLVLVAAGSAPAQSGAPGSFTIDRYTIDGGGGTSTGGPFSMTGTIGQYDANPFPAQGGPFTVIGGFWGGGVHISDEFFRDGFENP